jgi:ribonuclease HI
VNNHTSAVEEKIDAIVEAVQQLTPAQRRQLQRRLRVSGLFVPEISVADQQRLRLAPALGLGPPIPQPALTPGETLSSALVPAPANRQDANNTVDYHSSVSGKVVLSSPQVTSQADDPHRMSPLPGQAPEEPIDIIFDGGSRGNPGLGYGSYALRWPGIPEQIVKLRFGNHVTNNEAEYDALIAALEAVLKRLQDHGAAPATARLDIRGDSLLVINQVLGKWQCKEEKLQARRDRVRQLLQRFGHWRLTHHGRAHSVEVLGH